MKRLLTKSVVVNFAIAMYDYAHMTITSFVNNIKYCNI